MLSTPERLLSNAGTAAHIGRAVCSVVPEYTDVDSDKLVHTARRL